MTGVTPTLQDQIKESALARFDAYTHMAWGTGTGVALTTLHTETVRKALSEAIEKNVGAGTYEFNGLLGLTEGNGGTIAEVGIFSANSGGVMAIRKLFTTPVAKNTSIELSTGIRVTVTVTSTE